MEKAHSVSSWRGPLGDRVNTRERGLSPKEMALGRPIQIMNLLLVVQENLHITKSANLVKKKKKVGGRWGKKI